MDDNFKLVWMPDTITDEEKTRVQRCEKCGEKVREAEIAPFQIKPFKIILACSTCRSTSQKKRDPKGIPSYNRQSKGEQK